MSFFQFHYGRPKNPLSLQARVGALRRRGEEEWTPQWVIHRVRWWAGLSWSPEWFIGFVRFERTDHVLERRPASDKPDIE